MGTLKIGSLLVCLSMWLGGTSMGEDQITISGTEQVATFSLVKLTVTGSCDTALWTLPESADAQFAADNKSVVWVAPPGTYSVSVVTAKVVDGKVVLAKANKKVTIGDSPIPNPPAPPVPPAPPTPSPLRVLIYYESSEVVKAWSKDKAHILTSLPVRQYLATHCPVEDGVSAFRIFDREADVSASPNWKECFDYAAKKSGGKAWIVIVTKDGCFDYALPEDEKATLALLKKYGGE